MKIAEEKLTLKNNREIIIRSLEICEAKAVLDFMYEENCQSYFMSNYPEEIAQRDVKNEEEWIKRVNESEKIFCIAATDNNKIIGTCGIDFIADKIKMRHRAGLGIGLLKDYTNIGLGTILLNKCIDTARKNGFEQIELEVYEDNSRAFHLYQKSGFKVTGVIPRAFKLKDGSYHDAILMTLIL